MKIGGFQKFSLIEFPEKISAIVFAQGCNFRCGYCHNPELVNEKFFQETILEGEVLSFLEQRKGKLDAVVVTGGEPLLQNDLASFLKKVKELDYLIKIDTNGYFPEKLKELIEEKLIDYVAMDVKAPLKKYSSIVYVKIDSNNIIESIKTIIASAIDYEFRTTIVRSQLNKEDVIKIGKMINGAKLYALQKFRVSKHVDKKFLKEKSYSDEDLLQLKSELEKYVDKCIIR